MIGHYHYQPKYHMTIKNLHGNSIKMKIIKKKTKLKPNWNISEPQNTKKRTTHQNTGSFMCTFTSFQKCSYAMLNVFLHAPKKKKKKIIIIIIIIIKKIYFQWQIIFYFIATNNWAMEWEDSDWEPIKITTFASWFIMYIPLIFFGNWLETAKQMSASWT